MLKKVIVFWFCFSLFVNAQEPIAARFQIELFIVIENIESVIQDPSEDLGIYFVLDSLQPFVYENELDRYVFNYSTNSDLLYGTYPHTVPTELITSNSTYPNNRTWGGFDFISGFPETEEIFSLFAYGIYKLSAYKYYLIEQGYYSLPLDGEFYLDVRDSFYPRLGEGEEDRMADFYFKYDCSSKSFSTSGFYEPNFAYKFTRSINENEIISTWDLRNISVSDNSLMLASFWSTVLISFIDQGPNPYLLWSAYPDEDVSYYKIYKKKNSFNYSLLGTTTNLYYQDTSDLLFIPGYENKTHIYYYVTAVYGQQSTESSASNSVDVTIGDLPSGSKISAGPNKEEKYFDYKLNQNYPNPFNPTTNISYSLAKKEFVSLKVFNSLGQEVSNLVNGFQNEGRYNVQFNSESFPSGIYFYTLKTGNFTSTKKCCLSNNLFSQDRIGVQYCCC